jgi:DNA-binding transcriptional regulator GbsR (MarR family)
MKEISKFGLNIKKIEDQLIQFMSSSPIFFTKDPFVNIIRAYFITRKSLTQREIQKLTNLSSGKISQVLKILRKWELIKKTNVSSTGEYTYTMDSIEDAFLRYFNIIMGDILKWEKPLEEMKKNLEEGQEEIKTLKGYDEISNLLTLLLRAIKINMIVMKDFKDVDNLPNQGN